MAKTPPVPDALWPLVSRAMGLHTVLYRATRGTIGHYVPFVGPMLLLEHVGAKSGIRRTSPLLYLKDGDDYVIVASKGGSARHPAWFHNLRAHPDATIQVGSRRIHVHARVADAEERARLWPRAVQLWSDYEAYQRRTDREIPMVVLEPRESGG